jgi:hypothetical protein
MIMIYMPLPTSSRLVCLADSASAVLLGNHGMELLICETVQPFALFSAFTGAISLRMPKLPVVRGYTLLDQIPHFAFLQMSRTE